MPLDHNKDATNLDATQSVMTAREKQNRFGQKHNTIHDVGNTGFLSILAVTTPSKLTPIQWGEIMTHLAQNYGVTGMQALYEIDIPEPESGCQNNLYTSAHLRQDSAS